MHFVTLCSARARPAMFLTVSYKDFRNVMTCCCSVAVSAFLRSNDPAGLREFEGTSVTDVSGRQHPFETRPNALYRLASAHDQSFEHIYRIVI